MERFDVKTKIISGRGSLCYLQEMNIRRLLLVIDPYLAQKGWSAKILEQAKPEDSQVFDKISPDPTVELAAEGTQILKEFAPDTLVALGGGSCMDLAKAMLHFSGKEVKLVAIPSTSGSGSEVTDFSVLSHNGVKYPLISRDICPAVAILDSSLLESLPKSLIADTGFDVLTHALESYVAKSASDFTRMFAKEAFTRVYAKLPASYAGEVGVRESIHTAATMAGVAFAQSGLGLCHAMAHVLGGEFHIPHGRLCAILLPAVVGCNAHFCGEAYGTLARSAGFFGSADTVAVRNLRNGLCRLRSQLSMPATLQEAGVDSRLLQFKTKELTEKILADPCCGENPMQVEDFMVKRILEEVAK